MPECGNNFAMPQVQLPIFPAGVTHINSEVAFEERDGKVYYFNGHLPVFVHQKSALANFWLFSTQLVINGRSPTELHLGMPKFKDTLEGKLH